MTAIGDPSAVRGRRLVAGFGVTQTVGYGCLYYSFAVLLHPMAAELNVSPAAATFAATTAGLLGVLSVTGRLLLTATGRRLPLHRVVALQAAAAFGLPLVAGRTAAAIGAVIVLGLGLGFGIASLATPQLLADRYGTTAYASIAGILSAFVTLVKAGAPLAAASLLTAPGGYTTVMVAIGTSCLIAAGALLAPTGGPQPPGSGAR